MPFSTPGISGGFGQGDAGGFGGFDPGAVADFAEDVTSSPGSTLKDLGLDVLGAATGAAAGEVEDRFNQSLGDGLSSDATAPGVSVPAFRPDTGPTGASTGDTGGGFPFVPVLVGLALSVLAAQMLGLIDLS